MRESLARSMTSEYGNDTDLLEEALKAEEQNSTLYTSFVLSNLNLNLKTKLKYFFKLLKAKKDT